MKIFGATPLQKHGPKPFWVTSWSPHASPWNTRSAYSEHLLGRFSLLQSHGPWCSLSNDGTCSCRNTGQGDEGDTSVERQCKVSTDHFWFFSSFLNQGTRYKVKCTRPTTDRQPGIRCAKQIQRKEKKEQNEGGLLESS